jgi:outer membrane receptor protein involved in Fe transport
VEGPAYSPDPLPGYERYRAADHLTMTDARSALVVLSAAREESRRRASAALSWLGARSINSLDGRDDDAYVAVERLPQFGITESPWNDPFHVYGGEMPLFRRRTSQVWSMRADLAWGAPSGNVAGVGMGASYEDVELREFDGSLWGTGYDSLRVFHAYAPGGYAYAQGRWQREGMVVNAGVRLQYFTAGPQASDQTLGIEPKAFWSLAPRLGFAFPISDRDVASFAYLRVDQPPPRDFLYDQRRKISNRRPLGNPGLEPSTVVSYQAALKHLFDEHWALQAGVFYRDLFGQIGARPYQSAPLAVAQYRYENADEGHATGFELSVLRTSGETSRFEVHYTLMRALGTMSQEEGVPYGPLRGPLPVPIGEHPLDWDRRQTLALSGQWQQPGTWSVAWSTVVGSPLPWTPRERRQLQVDLDPINSRRLKWMETTDLSARWRPPWIGGRITYGLEVRNLFDHRGEIATTVDGYPNPLINTFFDDYGAYRTETGQSGGAYWNDRDGDGVPGWIFVGDPRLYQPPRAVRLSLGTRW